MVDIYDALGAGTALSSVAARELDERGFVVLPGPLQSADMERAASAYDAAVAAASVHDVHAGSTTTRVDDFVTRGTDFDALYVFPPLLEACYRTIGVGFKLSSLHARTLRPHTPAQELHVDVNRASADWPLVGFILMIDDFRPDNGATRFVPGSHRWSSTPDAALTDRLADHDGQLLATGPAGSLVVFNGSTWHGHTANTSDRPRRSLQGAFIPRTGRAATDFAARMRAETRERLGAVARQVLSL